MYIIYKKSDNTYIHKGIREIHFVEDISKATRFPNRTQAENCAEGFDVQILKISEHSIQDSF